MPTVLQRLAHSNLPRRNGLQLRLAPVPIIIFLLLTSSLSCGLAREDINDVVEHANPVMIGNGLDGVLYVVADDTKVAEKGTMQRIRALIGPCTKSLDPALAKTYVLRLDGSRPFPIGSLLVTGPAVIKRTGEVAPAVALAPEGLRTKWAACAHAPR